MSPLLRLPTLVSLALLLTLCLPGALRAQFELFYPVVGTGQTQCFDDRAIIPPPLPGAPYYGQDAQTTGNEPRYRVTVSGTVLDEITKLEWIQARGEKVTWEEAQRGAATCRVGGYNDWRMPTIKELYSLILFTGSLASTASTSVPFLADSVFEFRYGDTSVGERLIDCQDWSGTRYQGLTMSGDSTIFGVNFADGRIKGYPLQSPASPGTPNRLYVRYVRGNGGYGLNRFHLWQEKDSTIFDGATSLLWARSDSRVGMTWKEALAWVQERNAARWERENTWRLPTAKELQSLVDYSRSPSSTQSAAIDPRFLVTRLEDGDYPWYWTSTTHVDGPPDNRYSQAVYVAFGRATGWMQVPPNSGSWQLLDVHGAGAQRSDPKSGDPAQYPHGRGPQGDVVRVRNFVRLVLTIHTPVEAEALPAQSPRDLRLSAPWPQPGRGPIHCLVSGAEGEDVQVLVHSLLGTRLRGFTLPAGEGSTRVLQWDGRDDRGLPCPPGRYLLLVVGSHHRAMRIVTLLGD